MPSLVKVILISMKKNVEEGTRKRGKKERKREKKINEVIFKN